MICKKNYVILEMIISISKSVIVRKNKINYSLSYRYNVYKITHNL